MTTYMIFVHDEYRGTLQAPNQDEALDRAAIRFNDGSDGGSDDAIRITLEGDF